MSSCDVQKQRQCIFLMSKVIHCSVLTRVIARAKQRTSLEQLTYYIEMITFMPDFIYRMSCRGGF